MPFLFLALIFRIPSSISTDEEFEEVDTASESGDTVASRSASESSGAALSDTDPRESVVSWITAINKMNAGTISAWIDTWDDADVLDFHSAMVELPSQQNDTGVPSNVTVEAHSAVKLFLNSQRRRSLFRTVADPSDPEPLGNTKMAIVQRLRLLFAKDVNLRSMARTNALAIAENILVFKTLVPKKSFATEMQSYFGIPLK